MTKAQSKGSKQSAESDRPAAPAKPLGRRERKKAATRRAIADAALELFMQRDFDDVSIKEIADLADVSPTTVFAHFPQKEALVFDEDDARRDELAGAVRTRPAGTSVPDALRNYLWADARPDQDPERAAMLHRFLEMVEQNPSLRAYEHEMWVRHEGALAEAIAEALGLAEPTPEVAAYSHLLLSSREHMAAAPDPGRARDAIFAILDAGWTAVEASAVGEASAQA